ncbi:MAG: hypothetical protein B2I17_00075 [Thermoplasmatales archaeon B_DKE]|nr:MAG: hypothetical protein B2I17_00075 [Thermoplasmatales archaeon B_DKE]
MKQLVLPGFENKKLGDNLFERANDPRIIYYLGSKYRILPSIVKQISKLVTPNGRVCDLFSGSGSVAVALSEYWDVTTVDIQEYSRVITNALLTPIPNIDPLGWNSLWKTAASSPLRKKMIESLSELLKIEKDAIELSQQGFPNKLSELLRVNPLVSDEYEYIKSEDYLLTAQNEAKLNLKKFGLDRGPDTVITRYYGGVYFSWQQSIDLDSLLTLIFKTDRILRDHLLTAVFGAASAAVNTIGKHFAQPIQIMTPTGELKKNLVPQTIRDRTVDIFAFFHEWQERLTRMRRRVGNYQSIRADYRDALNDKENRFDLVYADPPYTRDHYSRFYHILETMSLHDEPIVSTTSIRSKDRQRLSRGLYRSDRYQSPFSIKSQASKAFEELGRQVRSRDIPMVLSYSPFNSQSGNRPRLVTIDKIVEILKNYFSYVEVDPITGFSHSKFNREDRNVLVDGNAEVLIICKP